MSAGSYVEENTPVNGGRDSAHDTKFLLQRIAELEAQNKLLYETNKELREQLQDKKEDGKKKKIEVKTYCGVDININNYMLFFPERYNVDH